MTPQVSAHFRSEHMPMLVMRLMFLQYMPVENALSIAISTPIKGKDS